MRVVDSFNKMSVKLTLVEGVLYTESGDIVCVIENVLADNETSISCNTVLCKRHGVVSILKHASPTTEEAKWFDILISKDKTNTDTTGSELNYFIPLSHPSEDEENASEWNGWNRLSCPILSLI